MEGHFYTYIQRYCAKHDISIEINDIEIIQPPRQNDECIMDNSCRDLELSANDCKKIYFCKSYLQTKWKSDLMTAYGDTVMKEITQGYRMYQQSSSKREEVVQERPNERTWAIWRKFLLKHICNKQRKAYNPLGCWNVDPDKYERLWPFYFSAKTEHLYRGFRAKWHSNETYTYEIYECIDDNTTRYSFDKYNEPD